METFQIEMSLEDFNKFASFLKTLWQDSKCLESGTFKIKSGIIVDYKVEVNGLIPTVTFAVEKNPYLVSPEDIENYIRYMLK
jgi:hypothetical protein